MKILVTILLLNTSALFAQVTTPAHLVDSIAVAVDDSTTDVESDTGEEDEASLPWMVSARVRFSKNEMKNGVSLSGANSTLSNSVSILHEDGLFGRIGWSSMIGSGGGPLSWSADLSYDYSITDWLDLSAGVSHIKYFVDSINVISDLENSLSLDATADLSIIDLSVGFEIYLGPDPAKYWTADISRTFSFGSLSVTPSAWLSYMSQTVDAEKLNALAVTLKKNKPAGDSALAKGRINLSGISGYSFDLDVRYDLGKGFKVYLNPSYVVTPKGEISSKEKQFWLGVGVRYSIEF